MVRCYVFGFGRFFFFQAEDGIRDVAVTGVQTCALPISFRSHRLIATASERSEATNEISSLKPFCFRSRGRTSFSSVWVNSPAVLAFRCMDTLRAYICRPLGYCDVNLRDYCASMYTVSL